MESVRDKCVGSKMNIKEDNLCLRKHGIKNKLVE